MSIRSKVLTAVAALALLAGTGAAAGIVTAGSASASTPLPAYPATTTLDLGSPNCVTDDVILDDATTSPITVTYGSDGSPSVDSHATGTVTYNIWYLNTSLNAWLPGGPPGATINPVTGVISATGAPIPAGSVTYTVRVHGKDSVGAIGTEQFQLRVNGNGAGVNSVTYEGNDFDNANGALAIQLNAGSDDSTTLKLAAIASSLGIPGSAPVTFTLLNPGGAPGVGWHLDATGTVLTGNNASDPQFKAVTTGMAPVNGPHDTVFFHLSGLSTDAGGVFYTNSDANPCVTGPAPTPTPTPTTTTSTPPAPPVTSSFGDYVNGFGNGWDVYQQHARVNQPVAGWLATQHDPAVDFYRIAEGSDYQLEYAPNGAGTGLCVSNPGDGLLVLRSCNGNIWQKFYQSGGYVFSAVNGQYVNPNGTGAQLSTGPSPSKWGGSKYAWTAESSFPA